MNRSKQTELNLTKNTPHRIKAHI